MKQIVRIFILLISIFGLSAAVSAQTNNSAPYCLGLYSNQPCAQTGTSNAPGNFINDFIQDFSTSGANTNINNIGSGCNAGTLGTSTVNYVNFCQHYLAATPGQTIVCTMRSGNTYQQGFAIWVDWNQDNVFNVPSEYMGGTAGVPAAATNTTITFVVPNVANGTYRMRVRCAYATPGAGISPCGSFGFGETEDYNIIIGGVPSNTGPVVITSYLTPSLICAGQSATMSAVSNYSSGVTFTWTGPGGYSNANSTGVLANAQPTMSGTYTVYATNGICPDTKTMALVVVGYPAFTISPASATICQGGSVTLSANLAFGSNPSNFSFNWLPLSGGGVFSPFSQNTAIYPPLLPSNVNLATIPYSVTISSTLLSCPVTKTIGITINNPLTPSLTMPAPLCDIFSPVTLTASPPSGTWTGVGNNAVTPGGLFNPALANFTTNTVMYSISIGTCIVNNTGTISVSQFNTAALTGSLSLQCVQDPTVNLMTLVQSTVTGYWTGGPYVNADIFTPSGLATGNYSLVYNTFSTPDPTVCPTSTVLVVSVFNPPTPLIRPIKPFCNTDPQTVLTATPSGGVWSVVSGVTSTGILTPSSCAIPNNTVAYTAGIGTCVATSTANFNVSRFNTAALTGTMPNLCVSSRPVNLMSIVQSSVQGTWTGPNVVSTYSFNPLGLPTGTYVLTYNTLSSPDPTLCPDVSTIAVSVLNPVVPSITMVGPYCNKAAPVQMSVSPNTGSWTAMPYLSPSGLFSPSLASIGSNPVQYVTGTSTCNAQQTKFINIEAFVSSAIINKIPDQCNSNSGFNLLPITLNGSGTWGGIGVTGSNFYPAMSGAGNFVLSYSTSSIPSGLCPDHSTVAVNVFSLSTPVINPAGPYCNNTPMQQLLVSPVGGIFAGANTNAVSTKGLFNPAFAVIGNNIVSYSISSGPCIAFTQATINVEKFISANFATSQKLNFCQGDAPVNMFTYVENTGGNWNAFPAIDPGSSMFNPAKANLGDNVVTYQTFSSPDASLCPDTKTINVSVNETPTITLIRGNNTNSCAPVPLSFEMKTINLQSLNGYGYWNIGDGSQAINGLKINHTFTTAGVYTLSANYVSDKGCSTQALLYPPVTVFENPKANFIYEPDVITTANPEVYLNNLSSGLNTNLYQWTVTGYSKLYEINPKLTLPQVGLYRVTLSATSINGCKDEMSKIIEVKNDFNVFIPNSFTPNGDGINDYFRPVFSPYGLDASSYELEIFDRWGAKMFTSNDPNKAWDGTQYNLGITALKQETYVYKLKFKDLNGKSYFKTGNVTLLGD